MNIKKNRISNIDVIKGLKQIKDNSQDLMIIDPPYNIGIDFNGLKIKKEISLYKKWMKEIIDLALTKISSEGIIYVYGFSEILAHISVDQKIKNQRWLVWHYKNKGTNSKSMFQRSHESILAIWKNKPYFNMDEVRIPYTASFLKNSAGKKRSASLSRFNSKNRETIYTAHPKGAMPRDVFDFPTLAGGSGVKERIVYDDTSKKFIKNSEAQELEKKGHKIVKHPTQKPMKLTAYLINSVYRYDRKLNIVIPFAGSGSEVYIAHNVLDHDVYSFEIDKTYTRVGNKLLREFSHVPTGIRNKNKRTS